MTGAQLPDPTPDEKDVLLRTNEEFRQLVDAHHEIDEKIRYFSSFPFLTDQQRYEEMALKKQKLALKDRIEAMVRGGQLTRH